MNFNHALSVRSDHSLGESILRVDTIVTRAKELGFESVALTDTMSISALVPFTNKCKKEGIKPILGCVLRVFDDPLYRPPKKGETHAVKVNRSYQIKVYVKSEAGLKSLMRVLSKGNSVEYFYYTSRVGLEDVLTLEDVIVTTGDLFNVFHHPDHVKIVDRLAAKFPTYVELTPIATPLFDTLNKKAMDTAETLGLPLTASYPMFYADEEGADSLDVLRSITSKQDTPMGSIFLPVPYSRDWCFAAPRRLVERMVDLGKRGIVAGPKVKEALIGPSLIADACTYEFAKMAPNLPIMAKDEFRALVDECTKGWRERFATPVLGHQPTEIDVPTYKARLAYELGTLKKLGFSGYFLVVQDIVRWSKDNGVLVGPGRGSVGGSLIAYLVGITDVDPIRFNLMFERFINPDRIDLPDADLDFMSSRRGDVIDYITGRYGRDRVAGISNYSTLGPASALRDTGRAFGLTPFDYACSKQVEKEHGVSLSLEESAEKVADIAKFQAAYPKVWKHAVALEGNMRHLAQHAAGVIVAQDPIENRAVLLNRDKDALPCVNWDKQTVEDFGLIKMDILGLTTLDTIHHALNYVYERHKKRVSLLSIPLDDVEVLRAFGRGETVGVFQFESPGMRKLLKDLAVVNPLTFDDIAAATALYRPGPIDAGLVDRFIAVKQGTKAAEYDHPLVEPALKETYGVLTYQEQIMQVCRDLAGFTLVEADHVRKAMGKKDRDKMATYREQFVKGAVASGMHAMDAGDLWDKIEGFAGYAFNKSHSVEYSIVSYWTMWFKVRYPAEFYAAAMTVIDDDEKVAGLVLDARRQGITVAPPDINKSSDRIEIDGEKTLLAPFQAIKGISVNAAAAIMTVRERFRDGYTNDLGETLLPAHSRLFESFAEFEHAVLGLKMGGKCNAAARSKLQRVGAFAELEPGTPKAMSAERLKDRLELMPGITVDAVKAERGLTDDKVAKLKVIRMVEEIRGCEGCSLKGEQHPSPAMGSKPKFMMVFDSPNWQEARQGSILAGDNGDLVRAALKGAGISAQDGYFTTLVKAPKLKGEKGLTTEQINGCSGFLAKEIDILKPAVIIAMGNNAIRYFAPGSKGQPADLAGKIIYRPDLDASVVFGINPASLHFDGSKVKFLELACEKLAELIT